MAWAVGNFSSSSVQGSQQILIERWNGSSWTRVRSPNRPSSNDLAGVTIGSAHDAWAVGQGNGQTLILRWNGSTWKRQPS